MFFVLYFRVHVWQSGEAFLWRHLRGAREGGRWVPGKRSSRSVLCAAVFFSWTTTVMESSRRHQAGVGPVPGGPVVPAQRLPAALAVPGGSSGRSVKLPLHRLDRSRHGVQTHWAGGGEKFDAFMKKTKTQIVAWGGAIDLQLLMCYTWFLLTYLSNLIGYLSYRPL